jgi:hypothetical protein
VRLGNEALRVYNRAGSRLKHAEDQPQPVAEGLVTESMQDEWRQKEADWCMHQRTQPSRCDLHDSLCLQAHGSFSHCGIILPERWKVAFDSATANAGSRKCIGLLLRHKKWFAETGVVLSTTRRERAGWGYFLSPMQSAKRAGTPSNCGGLIPAALMCSCTAAEETGPTLKVGIG